MTLWSSPVAVYYFFSAFLDTSENVRLVNGDGSVCYENGDRTNTPAVTSRCMCGFKHFWDGKEYDNLPEMWVTEIYPSSKLEVMRPFSFHLIEKKRVYDCCNSRMYRKLHSTWTFVNIYMPWFWILIASVWCVCSFPISMEWNGEVVTEKVVWFQYESDITLNSNVFEVAHKLVQKHFPGMWN